MFIPLDAKTQLHLQICEYQGKDYLIFQKYKLKKDNLFHAGPRALKIPIEYLEQITIRLNALIRKKNKFELKIGE